jgi:hypothetical protein
MQAIPLSSRLLLAVFALYGMWGGWTLPGSIEGIGFPNGTLGVLLAVAPGFGFVLVASLGKPWRVKSEKSLQAFTDKLLGAGTHHFIFDKAGIALMLGLSTALTGVIGLVRSLLLEAGIGYLLLSTFFVSAGIGMLYMFVVVTRQQAKLSSAASDA